MTCNPRSVGAFFLYAALVSSVLAQEQEPKPTSMAKSPLASKQEMIRDRFERFQDRVFGLRDQLSESEPENAARLERALRRAGELGLADKLEEIIALLNDPSSLHKAAEEEDAWLANAQNILDLLLAQDADAEKRKEEMERLKEYQEQVERLLKEQKDLRGESGQAAATQRMKAQLDQAIKRAGELQKRQSALSQSSKSRGGENSGQKPGDPKQGDAQKQEELGRDTEQLSQDLKAAAEPPTDPTSDSPKLEKAREGASEASKSSQSSSQSMSQAAQKMQQGESGKSGGGEQQQQAEEALKKTLEQLEAARKALEEEPDPAKQAEKQEKLAEQTKGLEEKMQQDAAAGKPQQGSQGQQGQKGQPGQQGKEGSQSQSPPGSQNLKQAEQEMNKAAESLNDKAPADATPKQDKAIEQLQQARQELEKALEELRKEERAETLRDLEARIRDMLTKQKPINDQTTALDKVGEQAFQRAEHLQLADLSTQQRGLSEKAETCLHILDEDASTIAFPHIMEQLVDDMANSADRLATFQVGAITQAIQAEIIDALEQLLESVKKMQEENESQQGRPQQQQQGPQPLLPPSAELKLLRSSQLRINNRTGVIADQMKKGAEEKSTASKSLVKLSARQTQCADIAREIRDKQP